MAHGRHHARTISRSDEEWEAMKEPFRKCYIDQDMSLKEATKHLSVNHNFPASERQWERKKEHWGFTKYQKRETRQQFIEQALARGMNMEDILNASDIPVEGGGDDRAARRNWRRYVKRERSRSRQPPSQPHSPGEGKRRSFDTPGGGRQEHHVVEKTYDLNLPDGIVPDQTTGALPDSMMLEATSAEGSGQSPVQFIVVSEVNPPPDTNPAPEIFFSTWDDDMGGLQNHGPLVQLPLTKYADMPFSADNNMMPSSVIETTTVRGMDETYGTFQDYEHAQTTTAFDPQTAYDNQASGEWSGHRETNTGYSPGQQDFYENAENIKDKNESFPHLEQVSQVYFDPSFDAQSSVQPVTPRARAANDYFQSMTADPLAAYLSNMVDEYTRDVQKTVKNFLAELPKIDPKVLQKMIEDSLQPRRDLCLRTISKEIEHQARVKQRALESITEKCRNLERIMAEKNIDTRLELRELKARSQPRHPTQHGALDMSQWNAAMDAFVKKESPESGDHDWMSKTLSSLARAP